MRHPFPGRYLVHAFVSLNDLSSRSFCLFVLFCFFLYVNDFYFFIFGGVGGGGVNDLSSRSFFLLSFLLL